MSPQYCGNQLFSKLSLVLLYYRLFSIDETFVRWLYGLSILQIGWFISSYITKWLLCTPIAFTWDKSGTGTCIDTGAFLAASETINSLVDFAMIGLAIWIVQSLRVDTATKWRLSVLFSLGGLYVLYSPCRRAKKANQCTVQVSSASSRLAKHTRLHVRTHPAVPPCSVVLHIDGRTHG